MKKIALILALILLIAGFSGCNSSTAAPYDPSDLGIMEEKIPANASLDQDFADNRIMISIQNAYSLAFHTYTPEDFPEIECSEVKSLSTSADKRAKAIVDGNPIPPAMGMEQIDIQEYHLLLLVTLKNPGKENVLKAIKALENRDDILCVEPDYIISITD